MPFSFKNLLLIAALAAQGALAQTKYLAIVGAHIETGDGKVIEHGTVLIADNKIADVGDAVQIPAGAQIIDGKGLFVYPGFINAYSTLGLRLPDPPPTGPAPDTRNSAPATMWHNNRKGIRADVVAANCLDLASRLKDNYAMGVTTALISSGSGSVRGIASVVDFIGKGNVLLPAAAGELALRGGGFGGGGGGSGYPGTLFGVTALTRQVLIDAKAYAADPKVKRDPEMENLKPLVTGQIPALFAAGTSRELTRAERMADEFGLKLIINGGTEAYRNLGPIKANKIPVILSLDLPDAPSKKPETGDDATPQEVLNDRYETWVEHSQNPKKLIDAGVPIAFTVGGGYTDYLKGVRGIMAWGVPRDAALRAMTAGASEILGVSDKTGTLSPGKLANIVIMTGDFASEKSAVQTVVVEGNRIDVLKGGAK